MGINVKRASSLETSISIKELIGPSDIFSPESGGNVKARRAIDEMRTHGMIRLKPYIVIDTLETPTVLGR